MALSDFRSALALDPAAQLAVEGTLRLSRAVHLEERLLRPPEKRPEEEQRGNTLWNEV